MFIEAEFEPSGRVVDLLRMDGPLVTGYVPRAWSEKRETLIEWLTEPVQGGDQ